MSKKRAVFTIVAGVLAVAILSGVLLLGLRNNGFGFLVQAREKGGQPFGHDYTVEFDPQEDPVEALDINWQAGPVEIVPGKSSRIRVTETCSRELSDEEHMMVMVNGGTLEVQWDHNKFRFLGWLPFFAESEKALVIELPPEIASALESVECSNVSGETAAEGLSCEEGSFSSVSGALVLTDLRCEGQCELSTTSGDAVAQGLSAQSLTASTTSGALNFEDTAVLDAELDTVSGEMYFEGKAQRFSHSAISGVSHAELAACPEELDMSSVSGEITLVLPPNACFRAQHSSVSGEFGCDFAGKQGTYGAGQPQGDLSFSTTSGDILILQK